jgi:hypothetical protein
LRGEPIGLEPVDDRYWGIYFAAFPLARFDSHQLTLQTMLLMPELKNLASDRFPQDLTGGK